MRKYFRTYHTLYDCKTFPVYRRCAAATRTCMDCPWDHNDEAPRRREVKDACEFCEEVLKKKELESSGKEKVGLVKYLLDRKFGLCAEDG